MRSSDFNLFENLLEFIKLIDEKKQRHVALFVVVFILELLWFQFTKEEYSKLELSKFTDAFTFLVVSTIHVTLIVLLLFCFIKIVKSKGTEKIKSVKIPSKSFEEWCDLGLKFHKDKKYKDAKECYIEALKINPSSEDVHFNLAISLEKMGINSDAEKAYRKAIELKPSHSSARNNLAILLAKRGKSSEAETELKKAIEFHPTYTYTKKNLELLKKGKILSKKYSEFRILYKKG